MRVYVESNFILELVLEQEQRHACEEILTLAAGRTIELALPAFALIDPTSRWCATSAMEACSFGAYS